jgi:hypothetical protein
MSIPYVWPDDPEADRTWQRQQLVVKSLEPGDLLAEIDDLIAAEPHPEQHWLFPIAAYLLDKSNTPGSPQALYDRVMRLATHALERVIEQKLANPACWEVD